MAIQRHSRSTIFGSLKANEGLLYNKFDLICKGSEDIATESTKNRRFRPPLSFDAPSPENPPRPEMWSGGLSAEGTGRGIPLLSGGGEGAVPPHQKNFGIFSFEMVHFDAFWSTF